MRLRCLTLASVVLGTGVPAVLAQALPEPPPLRLPAGVRVRVWTRALPSRKIEGTLLGADSAAVALVPKGTHPLAPGGMVIPAADVTRLELALEKKRHWWQGALIGAAVGAVFAFTDDVDPVLCEVNENVLCSRGEAIVTYGLGSVAIGGIVGALIKTDRWTPAVLESLGPPSPVPVRESRARLSFQASFRF
jgi:hypothetical protein